MSLSISSHKSTEIVPDCVLWAVSLLLLTTSTCFSQEIDPAYHSPEEILDELTSFAEEYPDWVAIDTIGRSTQYDLPIWMAKLSDNPHQNENEPALLFIGQVHAEELIGIEITLELMRLMLENCNAEDNLIRLHELELYFIPTANPEGLRVVFSGEDYSFRKTCRDNIGDGVFRYSRGPGHDTSGVDINRNFGLHWNRGDTLYCRENLPVYNYYRGPFPFSETETQALAGLALDQRFALSISYHSSRSGANSELIIAPWTWDDKSPPDAAAIDTVLNSIAELIPLQAGVGHYRPVHATKRNGQSQDWFYQAAGTFQYLIEAGDGIQQDSATMRGVVEDNLDAAFFLMDLAAGREVLPGFGWLTVIAVDANSSQPLSAGIYVDQLNNPLLETRRTSHLSGRFDWLVPAGSYDVSVDCPGYRSLGVEGFEIRSGEHCEIEARLEPLQQLRVSLSLIDADSEQPVFGNVSFTANRGKRSTFNICDEHLEIVLAEGFYDVEVVSPEYLPYSTTVDIHDDTEIEYRLSPVEIIHTEDFDDFGPWQRGGVGQHWATVMEDDRTVLTESPDGEYIELATCWLLIDTRIRMDTTRSTVLELIHHPYFEPGDDWGLLQVWDPFYRNWTTTSIFTGFPHGWDTTFIYLDNISPGNLHIRFKVESDSSVGEDGWWIDRLRVLQADKFYDMTEPPLIPWEFQLCTFPNPFNRTAQTVLVTPLPLTGTMAVYDVSGRQVAEIFNGSISPGTHRFILDGASWSSGQYYVLLHTGEYSRVIRLINLK